MDNEVEKTTIVKVIHKWGLLFVQSQDLAFTYWAVDCAQSNYRESLIRYCIEHNFKIHPNSKECFNWMTNDPRI